MTGVDVSVDEESPNGKLNMIYLLTLKKHEVCT